MKIEGREHIEQVIELFERRPRAGGHWLRTERMRPAFRVLEYSVSMDGGLYQNRSFLKKKKIPEEEKVPGDKAEFTYIRVELESLFRCPPF